MSASSLCELLSSTSFVRAMFVSLMPLLLVKPLMGLGPDELDLEVRVVPDSILRKMGLIIGRQAEAVRWDNDTLTVMTYKR